MPVTPLSHGMMVTKQVIVAPHNHVCGVWQHWMHTAGAHVFFDGAGCGDVLHGPLAAKFHLRASATAK
jgi:hypothetical protein